MSDVVKERYIKYRDIKVDNVRNEGEIKQEVSLELNSFKLKGSIENIKKIQDVDFDSDCGSFDNRYF